MIMKIRSIVYASLAALLLTACGTPKKISYFQDVHDGSELVVANPTQIRLEPKDKISILVNSQDPRLTNLFNLPILSSQLGTDNNYTQSRGLSGYTVNSEGDIDFPVLGKVHVAGLTREQVAEKIKSELEAEDLVKNPVVTVEFMNFGVSVLGAVNRPGTYDIKREDITVLDAISMAGDLSINGMRENVKVTRNIDGKKKVYEIDLNSAQSVLQSPAYYLKQNDIIYVEPNDNMKRQSTVNGNNLRSTSFWISLASLLTSVAVLIFK